MKNFILQVVIRISIKYEANDFMAWSVSHPVYQACPIRIAIINCSRLYESPLSTSLRVHECESDLEDLGVICFNLLSQVDQLLVFLLSAGWILFFTMVGQLVDLERVVQVL